MPDWDRNSPKLRKNLARVLEEVAQAAGQRLTPTIELARRWQKLFMEGLDVKNPRYVGSFRGEAGLKTVRVQIGSYPGVAPAKVAAELRQFERKLQAAVARLDEAWPPSHESNTDQLAAILELCAWAHAEWVRIHPFANGNGRTARLWANFLAIRYGLPPFVRLRPRPDDGYGRAGAQAMQGNWKPTTAVFRRLLIRFLEE